MFQRNITSRMLAALGDNPVVMLHGARQTGKTTLVRTLAESEHRARYMTFDDAGVLAAAESDPAGFLAGLGGPVILDEVQRAPGLFLPLKAEVDRDRRPGRFLLTGSAHALLLPRLADSLAGRMEVLTLRPISQGEREGVTEGFIDALFAKRLPPLHPESSSSVSLESRVLAGGFPEVLTRRDRARRRAWFGSYITALLQRDVRDLAAVERLAEFPRLLSLLATRSGSLINFASLAGDAGIPQSTLKRYVALLEAIFLVEFLPPWFANIGKRLVKSPKIYLSDSGLMAHLLGLSAERIAEDRNLLGPLLETFVVSELRKQTAWCRAQPQLHHCRTQRGHEVDIVLEDHRGQLVGIEVKASATVSADDFRVLRDLSEALGPRFHRGVVLHTGQETIPFGKGLNALPIGALWRLGAKGG
ncbi:ATP-binding protein [Candidatus Sumerlaeota bacterium]|nr:ATP-binding protein [Candidatus Sumerlaeota bacterium]